MFNFFSSNNRIAVKNGKKGEQDVKSILSMLPNNYVVFNNMLLKTKGGTTQIDHVVISPYGIFCIETKSHKGRIYGNTLGKYWTQCLYNRPNYTFYSPFKQNNGHIKNLCMSLQISSEYFLSVICFTSPDVDLSHVNCLNVCTLNNLFNVLTCPRKVIFSMSNMNYLVNTLKSSNIESSYRDKKHINYVKSLQRGKR